MIVTIDGPVASGKSTISKLLADRLSYYYINSGLLYRSIAYIFVLDYGYTDKDLYNISYQEVKDFFLSKKIMVLLSSRMPFVFQMNTRYIVSNVVSHV